VDRSYQRQIQLHTRAERSHGNTTMYVRTIRVPSTSGAINEYVRVVEAFRENGKVKQRTIADLGRKDLLLAVLPQLERLLKGVPKLDGQPEDDIDILDAATWGPVLAVRALFEALGLWHFLDQFNDEERDKVPFADRAFVLIANRLVRPSSEHGLARWLETDFVCDRLGRRFMPQWKTFKRVRVNFQQLHGWYRTLDRLERHKNAIEVCLYERLRDLFSIKPDLVFYDITSTYFEGAGPEELAKHGYSRDQSRRNVQVIVGVVMVAGWPITHHIWQGNRRDATTVIEVLRDLKERFDFQRVVFVGDRGMVSEDNLKEVIEQGQGYLLGVRRRQNPELSGWLEKLKAPKWIECPVGITASEQEAPPRTRVQEVPSGEEGKRVFVIDSDERRAYEQRLRGRSMEKTRLRLEKLQKRVAEGKLKKPEAIGAAAARALSRHHGDRYYRWSLNKGVFTFEEHPVRLPREKQLEGKYVLMSSEKDVTAQQAVAQYKELMELERGFRSMKDVLAMRPIYHRVEPRVRAHIFVATLALLLQRLLERRLREAKVNLSAEEAMQTLETIRVVQFRLDAQEVRQGVSIGSPRARRVLKALGLRQLRPPVPPTVETLM
jgi:transposase